MLQEGGEEEEEEVGVKRYQQVMAGVGCEETDEDSLDGVTDVSYGCVCSDI